MIKQLGYLRVLVFVGGLVTLGVELSASRLLAPYFGSSLIVWSSLIGIILVSLALGYWIGGLWVDRSPELKTLLLVVGVAAVMIALVPFVSRPVLQLSMRGFSHLNLGLLIGSFFGVLTLLGLPMVLLGCITPFALRLANSCVERIGHVAGQLFALSTLGSFLGSFLPVVVLIPYWGTRRTFLFFSYLLIVVVFYGWCKMNQKRWIITLMFLIITFLFYKAFMLEVVIKPHKQLVYETESAYQYIRVLEDRAGWRSLQLNEGIVTHSKYHPRVVFTGGEWDYFVAAPYFQPFPFDPFEQVKKWAVIGSGAGTTARIVHKFYGSILIQGVEIDPKVVEVGKTFFNMDLPHYEVSVKDGRAWLMLSDEVYDVITIDAYRQPYIPFELATVEFFKLVYAHLADHGVVAINVARTEKDLRLVNTLASTMKEVFASVCLVDVHHQRNTHVIGAKKKVSIKDFHDNIKEEKNPKLTWILQRAKEGMRLPTEPGLICTDDWAPLEKLMDLLVFQELLTQGDEVSNL